MSESKKTSKLRFCINDDLMLLREVLGCNPFEDSNQWINVQRNLVQESMKNFSVRAVREHTEHLIKLFKRNDRANSRKSGTEEQYTEKEQLLQQVADLEREFGSSKRKKNVKSSMSDATFTRNTAASSHFFSTYTLSDDGSDGRVDTEAESSFTLLNTVEQRNEDPQTIQSEFEEGSQNNLTPELLFETTVQNIPKPKLRKTKTNKLLKNDALKYLNDKKEAELKIRQRELELEERKLAIEEKKVRLEEQKFEVEKEERTKRLKLEIEERAHKVLLEKQLAEINSILIKHLINK